MTSIQFSLHPAIQNLLALDKNIRTLHGVSALLGWDQETYMPPAAAHMRSTQLGLLASLAHSHEASSAVGDALRIAEEALQVTPTAFTVADAAFLRELRRSYTRATKLPIDLVERMSVHTSRAMESWRKARQTSDFSMWAEDLQTTVRLTRESAECIGYEDALYDALLDPYEPGMKAAELQSIFASLQKFTTSLLRQVQSIPPASTAILERSYPIEQQKRFNVFMAEQLGYNMAAGRLDASTHPFSTTIGTKYDARITTRYNERNIWSSIGSTIHEVGHALYEQGIADALDGTILGQGVSLGIHESQSRLYENMIGKSAAFWQFMFPHLVSYFPDTLALSEQAEFVAAINALRPGYIRTESDELTYNLHIILRFELELALLDGTLSVADAPAAWKQKMQQYIGICPQTDAEGILQDVHWSMGSFGYFPTYTLGNLYSAQLWQAMQRNLPTMSASIASGQLGVPLDWLRTHIHSFGSVHRPAVLCAEATGATLQSTYLESYLAEKYSPRV